MEGLIIRTVLKLLLSLTLPEKGFKCFQRIELLSKVTTIKLRTRTFQAATIYQGDSRIDVSSKFIGQNLFTKAFTKGSRTKKVGRGM